MEENSLGVSEKGTLVGMLVNNPIYENTIRLENFNMARLKNCQALNVRRGPDITFDVVYVVKDGESIEVLREIKDAWVPVKINNSIEGYVMLEFLQSVE